MTTNLKQINEVIENGPYQDNWQSLSQFKMPDWFKQAKFGLFFHWGLYTVPSYRNEWYSRNMYIKGYPEYEHHIKTYGPQKEFGYKDFIPMFKAEKFDPDSWMRLIKKSGAKYIFPVAEHHDGFQMYKSELSKFNAYNMGPKRDIIGELSEAARKNGIHFCTSSHRAEHWWFMGHGKEFDSDIHEPLKKGDFYWPAMPEPENMDLYSKPYPTEEYLDDWLLRTVEIIDKYKPELLYFDWWIRHDAFKSHLKKLIAYYYNKGIEWNRPTAICYKLEGMAFGTGIVDVERGQFPSAEPFYWQTDTAIARNSWCYTTTLDYKDINELLINLIDVVSKNGNLLLNVGPKPDGSFAKKDQELLEAIGQWLEVNGESIYESKPWLISSEGPTHPAAGQFQDQQILEYTNKDYRFTANHGYIYCLQLHPDSEETTINSFGLGNKKKPSIFEGAVKDVQLLGIGTIDWQQNEECLKIKTMQPANAMPRVFRVEVK